MKKKHLAAAVLVIMAGSGCSQKQSSVEFIRKRLDALNGYTAMAPNTYRSYYSCWIDPGIGIVDETGSAMVLNDNGNLFLMALTPDENSSDSFLKMNSTSEEYSISFVKENGRTETAAVYLMDDSSPSAVVVRTKEAILLAQGNMTTLASLCPDMIRMAAGINTDSRKLKSDFFQDEATEYSGREIQLFKEIMPENGLISELMPDENQGESSD